MIRSRSAIWPLTSTESPLRIDCALVGHGRCEPKCDFPHPLGRRDWNAEIDQRRELVAAHRRIAAACRCWVRTGRLRSGSTWTVDGVGAWSLSNIQSHLSDSSAHLPDSLDSDCHSLVWGRRYLAHLSDLHFFRVPNDRADGRRRTYHRETLPAGSGEFRCFTSHAFRARGGSCGTAADPRWHAHWTRCRPARGGGRGNDCAAPGPWIHDHGLAQRRQSL